MMATPRWRWLFSKDKSFRKSSFETPNTGNSEGRRGSRRNQLLSISSLCSPLYFSVFFVLNPELNLPERSIRTLFTTQRCEGNFASGVAEKILAFAGCAGASTAAISNSAVVGIFVGGRQASWLQA